MPIRVPKISPWGKEVFPPSWEQSPWQRSTRDDEMVNRGCDDQLPESAEVVVIGSGLAGTATAHYLLDSPNRPQSVVVLEAREACSGASGRNAGHCRPDAFRGYNAYAKVHGGAESKKIIESERITLNNVDAFVKKHGIDCEWKTRPTLDLCLTPEFGEYAEKAFEDAKAAGIDVSKVVPLSGDKANKISRSTSAVRGYQWDAASINPAKLCYGVHHLNFELGGYTLFTHTPVTSVISSGINEYPWLVQTTRGNIRAQKVVYATNGYTKLILPEMEDLIVPFKAQAVKLAPPPAGSDHYPFIEPTMSLRYELHRFYSVMQRDDQSIVLASTRTWPGQTEAEKESLYNTMDDSEPSYTRGKDTMEQFCKILPGGGYDVGSFVRGQGGFDYHWSGILGLTPDSVPFVGPLPGKEGQYMIAGFNGHGMARIFHCAPCLAKVILNGIEHWDDTVPSVFQVTSDRLAGLRAKAQVGKGAAERAEATTLQT